MQKKYFLAEKLFFILLLINIFLNLEYTEKLFDNQAGSYAVISSPICSRDAIAKADDLPTQTILIGSSSLVFGNSLNSWPIFFILAKGFLTIEQSVQSLSIDDSKIYISKIFYELSGLSPPLFT